MRPDPPASLARLLDRLKLATPDQLDAAAARVARFDELAEFDVVWLDALVRRGVLSPYQAAEITGGRGDALLHGPYAVTQPIAGPHYAQSFVARQVETRRSVRLYVVRRPQGRATEIAVALAQLLSRSAPLAEADLAAVVDFGTSGECVWAACPHVAGVTAAEWLVENGRFAAGVVLHIAREMIARLAFFAQHDIVHGDVGAAGLVLQANGAIELPAPGLRGVVRPHEGYSFGDLRPEAYDYLPPERIADGTPPSVAGDVWACGALWWHLLAGRPPFPGGNSLQKLKAVHAARVLDVRQLAPEAPGELAETITACLAREPAARPSLAELAERLGPATRAGSAALATALWRPEQAWHVARRPRRRRASPVTPWLAGVAVSAALVLVALLPWWLDLNRQAAPVATDNLARRDPAPPATPPAESPVAARPEPRPTFDRAVRPAAAALPATAEAPREVVLTGGALLRVEQLELVRGAHVRGRGGQRVQLSVPARGLVVDREDITFEGIDFVRESASAGGELAPPGMLVVKASKVTFRRCSFSGSRDAPPIAIVRRDGEASPLGLGGQATFVDCVFVRLAAVLANADGALTATFDNVLCVNSGPLVRCERAPAADESIALKLQHVTTRGACAVLECRYARLDGPLGPIVVSASDSALAGSPRHALVVLSGARAPDRLVEQLAWHGQGSLLSPDTPLAMWRAAGGAQHLPEDDLDVGGLVRGEIEFAGPAEGPPAASRVVRWQVPLRSPDPPGANPNSLHLPRR